VCYRAENASRKAAGEEPLPEEDPANPIFKPVPEPSRLDSFLITNQMANYCNQINGYVINFKSRQVSAFSF
jgi:translation initiation factor 3 subunit H